MKILLLSIENKDDAWSCQVCVWEEMDVETKKIRPAYLQ